jgi:hypothetical protein
LIAVPARTRLRVANLGLEVSASGLVPVRIVDDTVAIGVALGVVLSARNVSLSIHVTDLLAEEGRASRGPTPLDGTTGGTRHA